MARAGKHGAQGVAPQGRGDPAPPEVKELADACMRFVLAKYAVPLDGTSDTLSILDQYVRDARAEIAGQPESLPLLQAMIGAYFGEVVRAAFEARWFSTGDHDGWRLDMVTVSGVFFFTEALDIRLASGCLGFPLLGDQGVVDVLGVAFAKSTTPRKRRSTVAWPRCPRSNPTSSAHRARASTSSPSWWRRSAPAWWRAASRTCASARTIIGSAERMVVGRAGRNTVPCFRHAFLL